VRTKASRFARFCDSEWEGWGGYVEDEETARSRSAELDPTTYRLEPSGGGQFDRTMPSFGTVSRSLVKTTSARPLHGCARFEFEKPFYFSSADDSAVEERLQGETALALNAGRRGVAAKITP
jgi:hypothetical protein